MNRLIKNIAMVTDIALLDELAGVLKGCNQFKNEYEALKFGIDYYRSTGAQPPTEKLAEHYDPYQDPGYSMDAAALDAYLRTAIGTYRDKVRRSGLLEIASQLVVTDDAILALVEKTRSGNGNIVGGLMTMDEMAKRFSKEIEFIYRVHLPKGMPVMVAAREGLGKTIICLLMAKEILETHSDHMVCWIATEGSVGDTFQKASALGLDQFGDRFSIVYTLGKENEENYTFNFSKPEQIEILKKTLKNAPHPVAAVFIDSVRGMTSDNPNDEECGKTMLKINAAVCDQSEGTTLVYLHHNNKQPHQSWADWISGSTSLPSAVRLVLVVYPIKQDERGIAKAKSNLFSEIPKLKCVKSGDNFTIDYLSEDDLFATKTKKDRVIIALGQGMTAKEIIEEGIEKHPATISRNKKDAIKKKLLTDEGEPTDLWREKYENQVPDQEMLSGFLKGF